MIKINYLNNKISEIRYYKYISLANYKDERFFALPANYGAPMEIVDSFEISKDEYNRISDILEKI
jgi:hypothetical protein